MACLKRFVYFEIGALFHSLCRRVEKRANFKINKSLQAIQSFLYCLYSKRQVNCDANIFYMVTEKSTS